MKFASPRVLATKMSQSWPAPMRAKLGPLGDYLDMLLVDHGVFREIYLNMHEVAPGMWRSAQPSPSALKMLAARGFKTILNLRGARACGSYVLEAEACRKLGMTLIDLPFESRGAPEASRVARAAQVFETIAYPALMHCKSGADRVGLVAALYLLMRERLAVGDAREQLSLRFGHFRHARTGVLDHFLDEYEQDHMRTGRSVLEWVQSADYDAKSVTEHFRANVMSSFLVDRILGRE